VLIAALMLYYNGSGISLGATAPIISHSIEGLDFDTQHQVSGYYRFPPDNTAAVSPDYVVFAVNKSIVWMTKSGGARTEKRLGQASDASNVGAFFEPILSAGPEVREVFDPRVLYDQQSGRFLVLALEEYAPNQISRILLAVSKTASPGFTTPDWNFLSIDGTELIGNPAQNTAADFVNISADEEALYLCGTKQRFSDDAYMGTRLWIVQKTPFYNGQTVPTPTRFDPFAQAGITGGMTAAPAHVFGDPGPGIGTYVVSANWLVNGQDALSVIRITNPLGILPGFQNTWVQFGTIFAHYPAIPDRLQALQPNGAPTIEAGSTRTYNAVYRNGSLYTATTAVPLGGPFQGRPTVHWFQFPVSSLNNATITLTSDQHGDLDAETLAPQTSTFYPWITVNDRNDVAISFAASGPNLFAGAYYTGRNSAPGFKDPGVLTAGVASYQRAWPDTPSRNRWGDYSSVVVDPLNGTTFWTFNQHATATGTTLPDTVGDGRWSTAIGSFSFLPAGTVDTAFLPVLPGPMVNSVFTQSDGNIIVGGKFDTFAGPRNLVRLTPSGTVDSTYSPDPSAFSEVLVVTDASSGQIVIAGNDPNALTTWYVRRLNANGTVDTAFHQTVYNGFVRCIKRSGDGTFFVGGDFTSADSVSHLRLVHLLANGNIDTAFPTDMANGPIYDVAFLARAIYIGGQFSNVRTSVARNSLAKINSSGVVDSTFSSGLPANAVVSKIIQYQASELIVGLFPTYGGVSSPSIAAISLTTGAFDPTHTFGSGFGGTNAMVQSVALQRNGKLVVGGDFTSFRGINCPRFLRIDEFGNYDPLFTGGGADNSVFTVSFDNSERILAGGIFSSINGGSRSILARLYGD